MSTHSLYMSGEIGFPLFSVASGPHGPGRQGRLTRCEADPACERREEFEVWAKPPDTVHQQQPAGRMQ